MKNSLPIVISILLGLAAVFAVSRATGRKGAEGRAQTVAVVVAARDVPAMKEFEKSSLSFIEMPRSAVPENALYWDNVSIAYGQRPQRSLAEGDIVMISDIRARLTLAECARDGEWTIPVTFADATLVSMLNVDDEIGILASFENSEQNLALDGAASTNLAEIVKKAAEGVEGQTKVTTLLMPKVRVLGLGGRGSSFRDGGQEGASTIFVSLPPQQAEIMIAAQQVAELYPVLRRRGDKTMLSRADGGVVTRKTFEQLTKKLAPIELPEVPNRQ